MQLFGLRKIPDLSHAPRQALKAFEHDRAQIQQRAVLREPPVRTFCQILWTQESEMAQPGASEIPQIKSRIGAILRATSGNFLEQFDFFLFGFYASAIAKAFFLRPTRPRRS
jgi:hypothetical protein